MKHTLLTLATSVFLVFWAAGAQAFFVFSDISYTHNSVSFTVDGDMSGYISPVSTTNRKQFSLIYGGDIFVGPNNFLGNSWSQSVFDTHTFTSVNTVPPILNGGTGFSSAVPYSWSQYTEDLSTASAINREIVLMLTDNTLDETATNPVINFAWGNGNGTFTILNDLTPIPIPGVIWLFAAALATLGCTRRKTR